jgi:hypothetical protein
MKTSAAIRVNAILEKAAMTHDKSNVLVVFAGILGLAPPEGHSATDDVMVALNEFREEIHRVEVSLKETGAPKDLRDAAINAALNLTSPYYLGQVWIQHRDQQLKPDVVASWKWIAHTARTIEDEVTEDALKDLELELAGLMEAANADGVSQVLRDFITRQADKIRRALRRYRVEGIEPLREAVSTSFGELFFAAPAMPPVETTAAKNAFEKFLKVLGSGAKVARDVTAMASVYRLLKHVYPALKHVADEAITFVQDGLNNL